MLGTCLTDVLGYDWNTWPARKGARYALGTSPSFAWHAHDCLHKADPPSQ